MHFARHLFRPPPDEMTHVTTRDPRVVYRWAVRHRWTRDEAGTWAAWAIGLEPTMQPWQLRTVLRLDFLRWLHERGRLIP